MIEFCSFTKKFGAYTALDSISFSIPSGVIFGLVGSNGAGKSTLLRSLAGVYSPDGGKVLVDGKAPFENTDVKQRLYFISDYPYFAPQGTLRDLAAFYARAYPGWNRDLFAYLCSVFPIDPKMRLSNMSKGMQRQCAFICAVSTKPDYLLMDEIFDGLDPVMRQVLKKIVATEVADRGMTVVIASHNMLELEDFCDHVGMLHKGGIVFERDLDSMKLGIHRVQAAFRPMPKPEQLLAGLDVVRYEIKGSLLSVVVRGDEEQLRQTFSAFEPIFYEALPLTLEEVFISEMEAAGYDLENILK